MADNLSGSDHVVIEMADLSHTDNKQLSNTDTTTTPKPTTPAQHHRHIGPLLPSAIASRNQQDDEFDQDMLRRAIADTGRWAHGTISVEAFVFSEQSGKLVRPTRAFWFDPVAVHEGQTAGNEAMMRLVDDTREDFVRPDPLAPGIGLAGALWSELNHHRNNTRRGGSVRNTTNRKSLKHLAAGAGVSVPDIINPAANNNKRIVWREVEPIANDPDQPYNLRLQLAVRAGIGLAAGVKFQFRGTTGLVIYMARAKTDVTKLKSATNEQYLLSAADVIGSIAALRGPRHVCLEERRAEKESVRRRVRLRLIAFVRMGGSFLHRKDVGGGVESGDHGKSTATPDETIGLEGTKPSAARPSRSYFKSKLMLIITKWKGSNNEPPRPFTSMESIWSFFGSFLTLLMLLYYSDAISKRWPGYSLVGGPFGALMTLQYSLTAAPASQPRNAILGQAISVSIAIGMTYTRLEQNVKKALATSLAIMCMARLGVTHPPAGAAALIFAGGGYSWAHLGIMLSGNILAILSATLINDMNVKRQYPTFWGFGYLPRLLFGSHEKSKSA